MTELQKNLDDTIRILLATDCHLGYEAKTRRSQDMDSFVTFEEILQMSHCKKADFILLGGDLFHDSKPSQRHVYDCVNLMKTHCFGSRPINIQLLSNPQEIFVQLPESSVNYEDNNLNISMPIFSIHGNHDNPSFESTGTLDILMSAGVLNYFGKWNNLQEIKVAPMIFKKGDSYVAIYGLGHVNEQRLSRLFRQGKVTFLQTNNIPNCFNILVLHQNRARHSENSYIAEDQLPGWFDFIFWGHEHECKIIPEPIHSKDGGDYFICQPGSSVATSLCEGESKEKYIGLLVIRRGEFNIRKLKLKTVRPFVYHDVFLSDKIKKSACEPSPEGIFDYIDDYIENTCIPEGKKMLTGHEKQPKLPLIRLKVFYSEDFQIFDTGKLCAKYCDLVANPKDMILFRKERTAAQTRIKNENDHTDDLTEDLAECFRHNAETTEEWSITVQSGIKKYFDSKDYKLKVLSLVGMNEALNRCVVAGEDNAFLNVLEHQIKKSVEYLKDKDIELTNEAVLEELRKYHDERLARNGEDDEVKEMQNVLKKGIDRPLKELITPVGDLIDVADDGVQAGTTGRGRGRGRNSRVPRAPRGSTSTRGRGRAQAQSQSLFSNSPPKRTAPVALRTDREFHRFANVSIQNNTLLTESKSQKRPVRFIESSDSD